MPQPSEDQRAALDEHIKNLVALAGGLTLDDFRPARAEAAKQIEALVRRHIVLATLLFIAVLFVVLVGAGFSDQNSKMFWVGLWGLSLGGLGAVANIFLQLLRLVPQETLKSKDRFEVGGRIVLGCLFGSIFAITMVAKPIIDLFSSMQTQLPASDWKTGGLLLLPFLAGYSITLVLGLIEKTVRAIQLTIGIEDDREAVGRLGRHSSRS